MNKKSILQFFAAVMCCLLIGCAATLALHLFDTRYDLPAPLEDGQTIDFSAYGFTLTVPDTYALNDYTTNNFAEGDHALFAGCAYGGGQELYVYCYENGQGDRIDAYPEQELVTHYAGAGGQDVRTRTLGGRRFICYRAQIAAQEGTELWNTYETWDERFHIVFETRMRSWDALAILQTITFPTDDSADQ